MVVPGSDTPGLVEFTLVFYSTVPIGMGDVSDKVARTIVDTTQGLPEGEGGVAVAEVTPSVGFF